jgi:hypothetical protein
MLEIKGDFPDTREQLKRGPVSLQAIKMEKHRIMKIKATLDGAHILETPDSAGH